MPTPTKVSEAHLREVIAFHLFSTEPPATPTTPGISRGDSWRKNASVREQYRKRAEELISTLEIWAGLKISASKPQLTLKAIEEIVTQPAVTVYSIDDIVPGPPVTPTPDSKSTPSNV